MGHSHGAVVLIDGLTVAVLNATNLHRFKIGTSFGAFLIGVALICTKIRLPIAAADCGLLSD